MFQGNDTAVCTELSVSQVEIVSQAIKTTVSAYNFLKYVSEKDETGSPEVPNPAAEMKFEVAKTSKIPNNRSGDTDRII